MIGAGGVATVAAFKIAKNADVFTEFMIASRRKEKCDQIVDAIHKAGINMDIKTAQVDADDVSSSRLCSTTISRAGYQPCPALSGPYHNGRLSGLRMQLSRHRKL